MARDRSGNYSLPTNSWNPATNGTPATAADWQSLINDVASAVGQSVSKDGQTAMTGNLPMGGNKITGLQNGTATTDAVTKDQLNTLDSTGVTAFAKTLLAGADAAAARTTLDVPTRTGGDASGTWSISISGNAATATTASTATSATTAGSATTATNVTTLTTAQVLAATTGAAAGSVGSYALLRKWGPPDVVQGDLVSGSDLQYSTAAGGVGFDVGVGTWRTMGQAIGGGTGGFAVTLFLRVA